MKAGQFSRALDDERNGRPEVIVLGKYQTENKRKFKFTARSISSIDINIIIMFFLFKKMPQMPSKNKIVETARYLTKSIEGYNFVNRCYLLKKRKKKA